MRAILVAALVFACAACKPEQATIPPSVPQPLTRQGTVGCYRVAFSGWQPAPRPEESVFWSVPPVIELRMDAPGGERSPITKYIPAQGKPMLLEAIAYRRVVQFGSHPSRPAMWAIRGRTLSLLWTDGFTAISSDLNQTVRGGFAGKASTFSDGDPNFHRIGTITLTRTRCPTR